MSLLPHRLPLLLLLIGFSGCFCLGGPIGERSPSCGSLDFDDELGDEAGPLARVGCPARANSSDGLTAKTQAPPLSRATAVGSTITYRLIDDREDQPFVLEPADSSMIEATSSQELRFLRPGTSEVRALTAEGDVLASWELTAREPAAILLAGEPAAEHIDVTDGFTQLTVELVDDTGAALLHRNALQVVLPDAPPRVAVELVDVCAGDDNCRPCDVVLQISSCAEGELTAVLETTSGLQAPLTMTLHADPRCATGDDSTGDDAEP